MIKKILNCSKILESNKKLLKIVIVWLFLVRVLLETKILENFWLKFYFPCSKSPKK